MFVQKQRAHGVVQKSCFQSKHATNVSVAVRNVQKWVSWQGRPCESFRKSGVPFTGDTGLENQFVSGPTIWPPTAKEAPVKMSIMATCPSVLPDEVM